MKTWLRWILVLPAAVAAYFGVQIAVIVVEAINDFFWDSHSVRWTQFVNSVAGPAAFVWCGAFVAPGYRFVTAICLSIVMTIFESVVATLVFYSGSRTLDFEGWWLIGMGVAGLVACVIACVVVREKEDEETKERERQAEREAELERDKLQREQQRPQDWTSN
jgi:hypothetical protein